MSIALEAKVNALEGKVADQASKIDSLSGHLVETRQNLINVLERLEVLEKAARAAQSAKGSRNG